MRDVLHDWERMAVHGRAVGRAVVTRVWGSAPRSEGACLLADTEGRIAGSVSGGCIESAAAEAIGSAIRNDGPSVESYGVSNEEAWAVGLACGGTIEILVEPGVRPELLEAARGPGGVVFATITAPAVGATLIVADDGTSVGPLPALGSAQGDRPVALLDGVADAVSEAAAEALARDRSRSTTLPGPSGPVDVFLELVPRPPKLIVFGGVHIAIPLVRMAKELGYWTVVADARPGFLARERFPDADSLVLGWPEEAFREIGIDAATSIVVLSHDPKLDDPALAIALRSPARYVGALGSRKTQQARRERLLAAGLSEQDTARLHGPVGLPLGGRAPAETALAILAEVTAVRYGVRPETTTKEKG